MSNAGENKKDAGPLWQRKSKEVTFFSLIAGTSAIFGFGMALTLAKKKDSSFFNKGIIATRSLPESGGALAMRALAWGTFYAVGGIGLLSFITWKLIGAKDMTEFTSKVQSVMPELPKNHPQGKSDFKTVRELVEYLINDGEEGLKRQAAEEKKIESNSTEAKS